MAKKTKLIKYIGEGERIFPNFGVFKPGDEVELNETLLSTGFFIEKKEGDE